MKTKNEIKAIVEIAIVLCSVLLVAIPAIVADQNQEMQKASASAITTASSGDDYVLGVYGNANEDDTIDMRDLTYVKLIFFGKKPETELADAKYDGKINPLDFIQIKLIIVGKEKELTIVDSMEKIVTVNMPIKRIVVLTPSSAEAIRTLEATDKIVGISAYMAKAPKFWPNLKNRPGVDRTDYEKMIGLKPEVVIYYSTFGGGPSDLMEKLEPAGIKVVALDFYRPPVLTREFRILGFLLDKEEKANEFIDFYQRYLDIVWERVEDLNEEEKKRVYFEFGNTDYKTCTEGSSYHDLVVMAGGINIFADAGPAHFPIVSPEEILTKNPQVVVKVDTHSTDLKEMEAWRNRLITRPGWSDLDAVKSDAVYLISWDIAASLEVPIAICYMAKWFYPELFSDLDVEAFCEEYLLMSHNPGVFKRPLVYHPVYNPDGR